MGRRHKPVMRTGRALISTLRGRSREGECAWISCQAVGSRCQEGDIRGRGCGSSESVNVSEPGPCVPCLTSPCESYWTAHYVISWTALSVISLCEVCWMVYSKCWGGGGASGGYAIFFSSHVRQPCFYRHYTSCIYDNSSNGTVYMRGNMKELI